MATERKMIAEMIRALRKEHGPRGVRLLQHLVWENGRPVGVKLVPLADSIQSYPNGKRFLMWNNRGGSTRMTPIP